MKTKAESLFEEMCAKSKEAMNLLSKGLMPTDVVREQEKAITEDLEDRFAQRPYGPLFIVEVLAKKGFQRGDVVYNEDGTLRVRYVGGEPKIEVCEIVETEDKEE